MANTTHEAAHGAAEVAGHAAEHSAGGMPQLDVTHFPNQIFWLFIALGAIYFVLSRYALPHVGGVLAERRGTITNDLAKAEELKAQAAEAEDAYNKALVDARAEANRLVEEAKAEIQAELDTAIAKADAEIAAKAAESEKAIAEIQAGAVESVKVVAKDTAAEIVSAMGGTADAQAIDAVIADRMKG